MCRKRSSHSESDDKITDTNLIEEYYAEETPYIYYGVEYIDVEEMVSNITERRIERRKSIVREVDVEQRHDDYHSG